MRFKEFLNEAGGDLSFEEGFAAIRKDCSTFLRESKEHFMYRGMRGIGSSNQVLEMPHRTYRAPKDSTNWFNAVFNAGIDLAFEIENVRSRAIFCTGQPSETASYGEKFAIFPKGDFEFIWSPRLMDSYMWEDDMLHDLIGQLSPMSMGESEKYASIIIDGLRDFITRTGSIIHAATIILEDDSALEEIFQHEEMDLKPSASDIRSALNDVFRNEYVNDQKIVPALVAGKEILLYQTDGFYAVAVDNLTRWSRANYDNIEKYGDMTSEEIMTKLLFPDA